MRSHLTHSVVKAVLQKSVPTQIRRLTFHISHSEAYVDGFVGELTSANRISKHPVRHRVSSSLLSPVDPSFRALSGRLKFAVRRHKFHEESLFVT